MDKSIILSDIDLVLYHKSCPDGWCAAYIAKLKYPLATLIGLDHGGLVPDVTGRNVLMVDFSLRTRELNQYLHDSADSLVILDHHKSAKEVLDGLPWAIFDMNRSGAGITWDTLFSEATRPWVVNYVEDRDLWRHSLPGSKAVSAYISTLEFRVKTWDDLFNTDFTTAEFFGRGALRQIDAYVRNSVAHHRIGFLSGYKTAVVNIPYTCVSDTCEALLQDKNVEIAMAWFERGDDMIQFSLRSKGDLDVSRTAQAFGGGGHRNAAGFQLNIAAGRRLIDCTLDR